MDAKTLLSLKQVKIFPFGRFYIKMFVILMLILLSENRSNFNSEILIKKNKHRKNSYLIKKSKIKMQIKKNQFKIIKNKKTIKTLIY